MPAPCSDLYPTPWEVRLRGWDWEVVAANGLTVAAFEKEWKARLFAGAPDLLGALDAVVTTHDAWDDARVAIAKARPEDFKAVPIFLCAGCHVPRTTVDESGKCKECRGRSA